MIKENKDLIAAVRKHADANYENGGWDYVVETFDDEEILEEIEIHNATTEDEAIAAVKKLVDLLQMNREEIQSTRF